MISDFLLRFIKGLKTRFSANENREDFLRIFTNRTEHYATQIDKITISGLPAYEGHGREVVLVDDRNLHHAVGDLMKQRYVGFDTESRPTFRKGEASHGISIIQICSSTRCYLFQMRNITEIAPLAKIIDNPKINKVGVGLKGDYSQLKSTFHFHPAALVDLAPIFKTFGRKNDAGSKQLVALVMNQRLRKSKRASTSNWSAEKLSAMQLEYASDDAFSSVDVYLKLRDEFKPYAELLDKKMLDALDL
ncbi:MAG: 3'-5' exonuclease domain-containing protein 2 [Chromatiales bacterium]|nr:3'-5' exonuclease domain-containing protein 2 [Chromatiales bacterium]